ncbi:hypothetical protein HPB51_001888 [Rhipicephalus microplus]|uniref:Uncharacterized protein n=1 Tax=Rhipicephalus microplus TaxID=6941 RepID=A0A9J6E5P0_RHIMP|nr:hypothetical protein HPB51_001888 [Rhipicephalus microplus]
MIFLKMTDSASAKELFDDFIHLDKSLKSVPSEPKRTPAVDANTSLFESVSRYTWLKALAGSHAGFSNNTEDLKLLSPNSKGAGQVIAELKSAKLEVARLYMLLAPVAPYMAVERFEEGQRRLAIMFTAQVKCLNNLGFLFPVPFDTAVASFLGAEKAAVTFNNLWSTTRLAGINALHIGNGYDISKDALMAASIGISETSGLDDPSFVEKYDGDFLANLVRYLHLGRTAFQASDFRSDSKSKGGFLPTQYFSPDYYYKDATEKPVNSGTLGALAAGMLFRKSVPHLGSKTVAYAKCLTDYSRNTLKLNVNESDWMTLTRARWATQVALATAQPGSSSHHPKEMIAMHYMRVARGYCGELEENRVPLKFVALTSQSFNRAFECDYPFPPMSC